MTTKPAGQSSSLASSPVWSRASEQESRDEDEPILRVGDYAVIPPGGLDRGWSIDEVVAAPTPEKKEDPAVKAEEDRRAALTSKERETEDERKGKDTKLFTDIIHALHVLGMCDFATGPISFVLIWWSHQMPRVWWVWCACVCMKAFTCALIQLKMTRMVHDWLFECDYAEGFPQLEKFCSGQMKIFKSLFCSPSKLAVYFCLCFPEYADMDLDAATACNALMTNSTVLQSSWQNSWKIVPIPYVGQFIAWIGLPVMMTALMVGASIYQVRQTQSLYKATQKTLDDWPMAGNTSASACKKRFFLWSHLGAVSDSNFLSLIGELCQAACIDICKKWKTAENGKTHHPPGRGTKFKSKIVAEAAPQLWFQISFVTHTFGISVKASLVGCVSVTTSLFFTLIETITAMKRMWTLRKVMQDFWYEMFVLLMVIFFFSTSVIRFAGIWVCASHVLNLTSGCMEPYSQRNAAEASVSLPNTTMPFALTDAQTWRLGVGWRLLGGAVVMAISCGALWWVLIKPCWQNTKHLVPSASRHSREVGPNHDIHLVVPEREESASNSKKREQKEKSHDATNVPMIPQMWPMTAQLPPMSAPMIPQVRPMTGSSRDVIYQPLPKGQLPFQMEVPGSSSFVQRPMT